VRLQGGQSQNAIAEATEINQGNLNSFMRAKRSSSLENF
jgi:hypothetical protein